MNAKKTECMVMRKDIQKKISVDITVGGNSVKRVTEFTYLGAKITSDEKK